MKDSWYLLGVPNFANYEASTALIRVPKRGGPIEYVCIGEDRLTRLKHPYLFPLRGIHYCLEAFGLERLEQVDWIFSDYARLPRWLNSGPGYRKLEHDYLKLNLRYPRERIRIVDHHDAHAASAFYPSGFEEAAVLVVDALGSRLYTQALYHFRGREMRVLERGEHWGIGRLYAQVTGAVLPYGPEKGFGKTMGLAPYGAAHPGPVLDFQARDAGLTTDYSVFSTRSPIARVVANGVQPCEDRQRVLEPYFARAAYDVQQECERQMVRMARYAHERTGSRNLCLAGGVGLNAPSNARILTDTPVKRLWITPACSDTGISFGAALWGWFREVAAAKSPKVSVSMTTAYAGRPYPRAQTEALLREHGIEHRPATPEEIAQRLADGQIVGWFEGGSEFGPRALGHRSILADPRDPAMKDRLNASVKFREGYRPYAPSILAEHAKEWFTLPGDGDSPFMLLIVEVRPDKRAQVPAITHVDHTTRPQTVTAEANPNYYRLLTEFHRLTGVPMVVNTSMNINREPIVETPLDALICGFGTAIDVLYLDGLAIECRRYADPELVKRLTAQRQQRLDEEWARITRAHLVRYDPQERDRYLAEDNKIAEWHRDYRAKYELEQAMLRWRAQGSRLLIVGTRAHTRCLYLYIPEFPQLDVRGFVPMDDEPGERGVFAAYPELALARVPWEEIDAVLISTHEYQGRALEQVRRVAPSRVSVAAIYDDAGDSLLYVLPGRWPVMNPLEAGRLGLAPEERPASQAVEAADAAPHPASSKGSEFDLQPTPITMRDRHAMVLTYHYCHPASGTNGAGFKGLRGVRPDDLDQQLRLLKRNFTFVTMSQLLDPDRELPESVAVLTFDDGLLDVLTHVLPVLERWDAPATIFCCSAPLSERRMLDVHKIHVLQGELGVEAFQQRVERKLRACQDSVTLEDPARLGISELYQYDDERTRKFKTLLNYQLPYPILSRLLSELIEEVFGDEQEVAARLYCSLDHLRRLQQQGCEIGVHTHRHHILSRLEVEQQRQELGAAADYFRTHLGVSQLHLAYPYGSAGTWNRTTVRLAQDLGYASGLTVTRRIATPSDLIARWEIPRFDVRDVFDRDNRLHADKLMALFSSE